VVDEAKEWHKRNQDPNFPHRYSVAILGRQKIN